MRSWKILFPKAALFVALAGLLSADVALESSMLPKIEGRTELASSKQQEYKGFFDSVERTQKVGQLLSQGPNTSSSTISGQPCADCKVQAVDLRYMQCDRRNGYLENQIENLRRSNTLAGELVNKGNRNDTVIKTSCMKIGMDSTFNENSTNFRACMPGENQASRQAYRPCISQNYFTLMNNAFDYVSRCMAPQLATGGIEQRIQIRAVFGMLNLESGLHINSMSGTGAGGLGQMTMDAIQALNRNVIPGVRQKLLDQGGACARLAEEVLSKAPPMRAQVELSCDRVSLARGNPMLNLIYSYATLLDGQRMIMEDILDDPRVGRRFNLSAKDRTRLKTSLSLWAHNTGPAGLKAPLLALLNTEYRGSQVTNVDRFLKELTQAMQTYPHSANSSGNRRLETSQYWPRMQQSLSRLERNVGGGSCLAR